jgi:hypothetical protein
MSNAAIQFPKFAAQVPVAVGKGMSLSTIESAQAALTFSPSAGTQCAAVTLEASGATHDFSLAEATDLTVWFTRNAAASTPVYTPIYFESITAGALNPAAVTNVEIKAILEANPLFARLFTVGTTTDLTIVSRDVGTSIGVFVTGGANTVLSITEDAEGDAAEGTGASVVVTAKVTNGLGQPMAGVELSCIVHSGATGTGVLATGLVFAASPGGIISGEHTNTAKAIVDKNGDAVFRIATTASGNVTGHLAVLVVGSVITPARSAVVLGTT